MHYKRTALFVIGILFLILVHTDAAAQQNGKVVIAYYSGDAAGLDSFNAKNMTHLIYCFGHLNGNRFHLSSANDTALIKKMVAKKKENPKLKVLLSLGGWGGCQTCSDVFSTAQGRS